MDDDEDDEPAPTLYRKRTLTPRSSFTSRGSQWRRLTLSSLDSAIDVDDHQQTEDEVEDVVRPPRKRAKRGLTATVTTVEPVASPASPAAEENVTGKGQKKNHKKRHCQEQVEEEAEEVVQASPAKKQTKTKKQREREVHGGLARRFGKRPGQTV